MSEAPGAEDAQRVLMELVSGPSVVYQPLDEVLDGPCLRVYFAGLPLALRLGRSSDGRLTCTGLLVGWTDSHAEVTSRDLRLPLGAVLTEVARLATKAEQRPTLSVGKGRRYSEEDYEVMAERYRTAKLVAPTAATRWLADSLGVAPQTASGLLRELRRRGLTEG